MHMIITFLIEAEDKKSALSLAKTTSEEMCGERRTFDYATFFDDESSTMSGVSRWGKRPIVSSVNSKEGKTQLTEAIKNMKDRFKIINKCI